MMKAEQKKWARSLLSYFITSQIKKHFSAFYLFNSPPKIDNGNSLILAPNHFSWWDGFFADHLCRKLFDKNIYLMMLEKQLKRYWFFSKAGAFSVNSEKKNSLKESLNYSSNIISSPNNLLILFPQGELLPFDSQVKIKKGLRIISSDIKNKSVVVPCAFKIGYEDKKLPYAAALFGNIFSPKELVSDYQSFEEEFISNIARIKQLNPCKSSVNILL